MRRGSGRSCGRRPGTSGRRARSDRRARACDCVAVGDSTFTGRGRAYDAFVSYARADEAEFRDALVAGMQRAGLRVWFDRESLPNRGTTFDQEIRRAIESSARLVLIVGREALSRPYVGEEWRFADALGLPVVPVLRDVEPDELPEPLPGYEAVLAARPRSTDAVVAELVRLLSEPPLRLGTCFGVPRPPPHALDRPELLDRLWSTLGVDRQRPAEAGSAPRAAVLYGPSGVGKSTIAAAFAGSTRSRRTFPDGIVWVLAGPTHEPLASAREVLQRIAPGARLPGSVDEVPVALAEGLAGREALLVLDDVRDPEVAAAFVQALGAGGRALVTGLDEAVATALGVPDVAVGQLDGAAARHLLEGWADGPLPPEAEAVLQACDGLPFALSIIGAMIRNRVPWARVVQALEGRRLDLLAARFPGYPYPNVLRALAASYDALVADDPRAAACYLELAAFRPGAALSEDVLVRLWSRPGRLAPLDASFVVPVLERRLLLQRRDTSWGERFVLHRLQEDFVRLQSPDTVELQAALIDSYRAEKGGGSWSQLRDDGYVFDHLIAHMVELGDRAELLTAVDPSWVAGQLLRRGDLGQALDDLWAALDAAARPPIDLPAAAGVGLLLGQVAATLRAAPAHLVGALAEAGDVDQALRWAADKTHAAARFDALVEVADVVLRRGGSARAREVVRAAAQTIPRMGGVVESGWFSGLTAMNAVHALVDFPWPDQWEGTSDEHVAMARIPLDALVRLAPIAVRAGATAEICQLTHPFWELYGHLIPLVAVERLATQGQLDVATGLLDERAPEDGDDDLADAARYRRAVATAAVGRFDEARAIIGVLPPDYQGVGNRGLARHLARAGRVEEAVELLGRIADPLVIDDAATDVVEATIERGDPEDCRHLADVMMTREWVVAAAWLLAAGGEPAFGLDLLDRADRDDLRLGLGVRLGEIMRRGGDAGEATAVVRKLVPAAERLLGPQWFAPETIEVPAGHASLARSLLALVASTGEPLPAAVPPLSLIYEMQVGGPAPFKLDLVVWLATAGRLAEVRDLAGAGASPVSRSLALATALATVDPATPEGERRQLAADLGVALDDVPASEMLDHALGAAMWVMVRDGLDDVAADIAERLTPRAGLWSAVGVWALHQARAGAVDQVRRLVRLMLIDRPLPVAQGRARAGVLAALAASRPSGSGELRSVAALLVDVFLAASALDVVFEVVALTARHDGVEAAGSVARTVAGGEAGMMAEQLLLGESITWSGEPSEQEIGAAAAARAVAAAAMVLVTSDGGSGHRELGQWYERAERLAGQAERTLPGAGPAVAKYVATARAVLSSRAGRGDPDLPDDRGQMLHVAWLLWDRGQHAVASRYARRVLDALRDPYAGLPQVSTTDFLSRHLALASVASAGMQVLLAVDASEGGQDTTALAQRLVDTLTHEWVNLTTSEQSEARALLAIGLQRCGQHTEALRELQRAAESAPVLARRGELDAFGRLCQAAVEVLGPVEAADLWAGWMAAAAQHGTDAALGLVSAYIRALPDETVADVTADEVSGRLSKITPGA